MKFWTVFDSLGQYQSPNYYKYATFWGGFFQLFMGPKKDLESIVNTIQGCNSNIWKKVQLNINHISTASTETNNTSTKRP